MVQNEKNLTPKEHWELEIVRNSIKQLIDKEIEELEELDRYANQQQDIFNEQQTA